MGGRFAARSLRIAAVGGVLLLCLACVVLWTQRSLTRPADDARAVEEDARGADLRSDAEIGEIGPRLDARAPVPVGEGAADDASLAAGAAEPWATILVDVVDHDGTPVAGVPVALACLTNAWMWCDAVSDEEGRARLELEYESEPDRERLGVIALGAFELQHGVAIPWPPPTEPVRLVLPPLGTLEVAVRDVDGELVRGARVRLGSYARVDPDDFGDLMFDVAVEEGDAVDGRFRFERVQSGLDLVVTAEHPVLRSLAMHRIVGPVSGTTDRHELVFAPGGTTYVGTLQDPPFDMCRRAMVDFASQARWPAALPVRAREDGTFAVTIPQGGLPDDDRDLWLFLNRQTYPAPALVMIPLAGRTAAGVHDLGALPSAVGTLLVEGQIVSEGRPRRAHTWIGVRRAPDEPWRSPSIAAWSEDDGFFRVYAASTAGFELEWAVLANGDVIPFTAGERGLVVDVSRPKGPFVVEGRVLSDTCTRSGVPHATGLAVVARTESTAKRATVDLDGGFAFAFQDDEPVTLELRDGWRGVLEGRADLRPLALGVVRDPPLIIDLRGRLRSIVVRGEDASGRPLGISVREASGPARSPVFGPPSEQTILVDRPSVDLVVSAYGWRDVRVDGVEDDLVVRFDVPARHIALVWPEIPKVPIDVRMRPIVIPRDAWTEDDQYAVFDLHGACFDTEGRASTVTGATGTMRVFLVVELRRGGGSWSHAYADEPIELEADAGLHGPVEVRWDPDEVASRIRELREM